MEDSIIYVLYDWRNGFPYYSEYKTKEEALKRGEQCWKNISKDNWTNCTALYVEEIKASDLAKETFPFCDGNVIKKWK